MSASARYEGRPPHGVWVVGDGGERPLEHHVKHSPTGFSWGYDGSGPAELARCLLIDVLGDEARCEVCKGTGRRFDEEPSEGACWDCDGGWRLKPSVYQEFKFGVIAAFPSGEPWVLPRVLVEGWLVRLAAQSTGSIPPDRDFTWVTGVLSSTLLEPAQPIE